MYIRFMYKMNQTDLKLDILHLSLVVTCSEDYCGIQKITSLYFKTAVV